MSKQYFYLYKITNLLTNKIYIGCHQTNNIDDNYMGSGLYIKRAYKLHGMQNFKKEILEFFNTAKEMFQAEAKIVNEEFVKNENTYNLSCGGKGGYKSEKIYNSPERSTKIRNACLNKVVVRDINGNILKVNCDDERFVTRELVGVTKGLATMRDLISGNIVKVDVNDKDINSERFIGVTKGYALMKDVHGVKHYVSRNDPRIQTGELVGHTKGYTQTSESNKKRSKKQKGIKKPQPLKTCEFCKKISTATNILRWHKKCRNEI
jgi:hypothetical protein